MSAKDFVAAKTRWKEWLDGDEHSINGQLSRLLWNDAVFRSLNEARRWASRDKPTSSIAPILAGFIDEGYVAIQVIGVGKLVEWSDPKRPKKGVISLRRLVDELIEHHPLLIRKNYLVAEQLTGSGLEDLLNSQFDRYAHMEKGGRHPTDAIDPTILKRLDDALNDEVFGKFRTLRHKLVAHAADAVSREEADDLPRGPTFADIDRALRILLGVRQVIQAGILFDSWRGAAIPVPQYNQFEHLDLPFVPDGGIEKLQQFWRDHEKVRDGWLHESFEELAPAKP